MSPGLSVPKASPVSASHLAPSRAPRHSPHPRDLYSRIQGLLRPPSVSRTGAMSLIPAAHLSGNSACFPQNQRPKRGEMKTLLLQSLRASGDPAPPPAAPQPPLSCSSSCFVTQRWESKCGDCCSHLPHSREHGHTWRAHTRLGGGHSSGRPVGTLSLPSFLPLCFVSGRKKPQKL